MGHQKFIPAFRATKIQVLSIDIEMNSVSFGKIYLTKRIFDHDIINFCCGFAEHTVSRRCVLKHPGLERPVPEVNNTQQD